MTLSITWLYQVVGTPWSSTQSHLLITLSTPIVTKLEHQLLAVTYKVSHDGASVWHSPHPTCSASLTVLQPADFLKHSQVFPVSGHLHLPFILLGMNRMIPRSSNSENFLFIFRFFAKTHPPQWRPPRSPCITCHPPLHNIYHKLKLKSEW